MSTIYMETTQIAPEKTISEIQQILISRNATSILTEYEGGKVASVSFRVPIKGQLVPFRLPCRHKAIQEMLASRTRDYKQAYYADMKAKILAKYETQAIRVAWRQILRWVQAQFALVDTGMVKTEEVFMPYVQMESGMTIFEHLENNGFKMLENKS